MIQSIKLKGMITQILSLFWWKQFWHYLRSLQQANNFAVCTSQSKESCWELTLKKNLQAVFLKMKAHPWSGNADNWINLCEEAFVQAETISVTEVDEWSAQWSWGGTIQIKKIMKWWKDIKIWCWGAVSVLGWSDWEEPRNPQSGWT
jgi:hypothetical protein